MKTKIKHLILLLTALLLAQYSICQINISGKIIDKETDEAIPYTNIWLLDTNIGTTSSEKGVFNLSIESSQINNSLKISSIGFMDTLVHISKSNDIIRLSKKEYQLSEIKVIPKAKQEIILNDLSDTKIEGAITNDTTPQINGRHFPYEEDNSDFEHIKSVIIYTHDQHKSKFNLRLYSFDTLKAEPINELVHENIIVKTKVSLFKSKPVEVDLTKYKLTFPKEGMLVAVEWLIIPENGHKVTFNYNDGSGKKVRTLYSPHLSATIEPENYEYFYKMGSWGRFQKVILSAYKLSGKFFIPAISLKLTD